MSTEVQSKQVSPGSGSSGTIAQTFDSNVTAGNLILVGISYDLGVGNATTISSVADTLGNNYQLVREVRDNTQGQGIALYYARKIVGGACTVTVTFSVASAFRRLIIAEMNTAADTLDQSTAQTRTATTTVTDATVAPAITPSAAAMSVGLVEIHASNPTVTTAPGTGYTEIDESSINSPANMEMEFKDVASPASTQTTWTLTAGAASNYIAIAAAFIQGLARGHQRIVGPRIIPATATTVFTCPAGMRANIRKIYVFNPDAASNLFTVSIGSDLSTTRVIEDYPVPAGKFVDLRRIGNYTLTAGETIDIKANGGNVMTMVIDGYLTQVG